MVAVFLLSVLLSHRSLAQRTSGCSSKFERSGFVIGPFLVFTFEKRPTDFFSGAKPVKTKNILFEYNVGLRKALFGSYVKRVLVNNGIASFYTTDVIFIFPDSA